MKMTARGVVPPGHASELIGSQTGDRTAISYLIKPISDQLMKAWRER
jgi:hypothetical protein